MRPLFPVAFLCSIPLCSVPGLYAQNPHLAATDAIHHVGQRATICGPIAARHAGAIVHGLPTFIDLGPASPAPTFTIIVWDSDATNVGNLPASGDICVTGTITQYKGVPQMVLTDAGSWSVDRSTITASAANAPSAVQPSAAGLASVASPSPIASTPAASAHVTAAPAVADASPVADPSPVADASPVADGPAAAPVVTNSVAAAPAPEPVVASPVPSYKIGADDSLQITIWQEPNLSGSFLVRPDGMISLVLAGDVRAAGLTPMELASNLTKRFSKFLQDPLVSVIVVAPNSQKIYVLGEVQHAGGLPMATTMSPLQAISAAGGLTPYAEQKKIYILRGPQGEQHRIPFNYKSAVNAKPTSSVALIAGDTIVVP